MNPTLARTASAARRRLKRWRRRRDRMRVHHARQRRLRRVRRSGGPNPLIVVGQEPLRGFVGARNSVCPCGSGRKLKACCGRRVRVWTERRDTTLQELRAKARAREV